MVTLSNQRQNGIFDYTDGSVIVNGFYDADDNGQLISINANYKDENGESIGRLNMYKDSEGNPQYNINGSSIDNMLIIAQTMNDVWNDVSNEVLDGNEEQAE